MFGKVLFPVAGHVSEISGDCHDFIKLAAVEFPLLVNFYTELIGPISCVGMHLATAAHI